MIDPNEPNWKSFAPITTYDKAGYVWIAVLYSMTFSLLVLAIRLWYKQAAFGKDDSLFIAASVAMMAHVACAIVALKNGLGTSPGLAPQNTTLPTDQRSGPSIMAAYMFLIVSLALAKSSTVMFIHRILSKDLKKLSIACYVSLAVFLLWSIGSMVAVGTGCVAGAFMSEDMNSKCGGQGRKWAVIAAFDAATELMLIAIPIMIVWPLRLPFYLKAQVVTAFAFRLGVVALSILHAAYMDRISSADHAELACVPTIALAECELCWSLMSATIPNLRAFMKTFNTGFGLNDLKMDIWTTGADASGSRTRRDGETDIPLQRLQSSRKPDDSLRPVGKAYKVEVMRGQSSDECVSLGSGHSQEMIIHKTVNQEVTYEHKKRPSKGLRLG